VIPVITKIMKRKVLCLLLVGSLIACQKDSPPPLVNEPGKAGLIFPEQNSVCLEGNVISPSESAVDFRWDKSDHTDSYEITVKNLITAEIRTASTTDQHLEVLLGRNAPYSWFITSKSRQTGVSTKSDVFRFYNAGPGKVSYAPFPAEILSPAMGQTVSAGAVNLDWNGNDPDGDLSGYDVYLGTSTAPELLRSNVRDSNLDGIPVKAKNIYYWRIVSRDARGNTSDSGLFQFSVK
jgi:hypothetical protein